MNENDRLVGGGVGSRASDCFKKLIESIKVDFIPVMLAIIDFISDCYAHSHSSAEAF